MDNGRVQPAPAAVTPSPTGLKPAKQGKHDADFHQPPAKAPSSINGRNKSLNKRALSAQQRPSQFVIHGQQAPLHPKPNNQQWQPYEQQQMLFMQQPWLEGTYPMLGHFATHDGSSPSHPSATDPNAPIVAQLIQQGDHNQLLAAYVAHRQAEAQSPKAQGEAYRSHIFPSSPGAAWHSPSTAIDAVFLDWNGCLSRQGSSALGSPKR